MSEVRTHIRSCAFCEAACGIIVSADHASRQVLRVRGDPDDPFSQGFICAKACALTELHADPDRLRRPVRRQGRDFVEIGWDEAIAESADRLKAVQQKNGRNSVAYYFGNPSGHKAPFILYGPLLIETLGSMQVYSPGTLDQIPKFVSATLMFGGPLIQGIPDIDRTRHLIIIGSNPVVSQGSMIVAPDIARRIKDVRRRGGKVVVIDPRRTETAQIADDYHAIRPGADAFLLFAMIDTLFKDGRVNVGRAGAHLKHLQELSDLASEFPPERAAAITGLSAGTIRTLARELAASSAGVVYGRTGTCTQRFGTIASWLIDVLNILTGNLDRAGGAMFTGGGVPLPLLFNETFNQGVPPIGRWHSRVGKLPESIGMLPTAALADEILVPGEGQVKALVTQAGNIALSNPNGAKLARAFESLDFMLSFDIYVNETTRHADIIIPGPSYAEHADFAVATPYETCRKFVKWGAPIFEPEAGTPHDWQIFAGIAARMLETSVAELEERYVSRLLAKALAEGRPECREVSIADARAAIGDEPGPDRIFDIMLRAGPLGDAFGAVPHGLNLRELKQHPHGLDFGPLTEQLPAVLKTPDQLIDMAPPMLVADVARMRLALDEPASDDTLLMIGRRHARSKNAWMHNIHLLTKGKSRCTLLMNPRDAQRRGLKSGDRAIVRTHIDEIIAPVEISEEMMQGVVSLPHGWGHNLPGTRQRIADAHAGVNANAIIDEQDLDVPSASTVLNGVPVTVVKSDGPRQAETRQAETRQRAVL
jgi:anaerobic selenocysteine-containing dehydrogenase